MFDIKCSLGRRMELISGPVRVSWYKKASLKESMISNYEFCCCLIVVLMKVSSGSALIIDKQLYDGVRQASFARGKSDRDHGHSRGAYSCSVCKLVDSTAKHELEASTLKLPIEGRWAAFCANLVNPKNTTNETT